MARGKEVASTEGLRRVRPVWEHQIDHVRVVMKRHEPGYTFCIEQHSAVRTGRLWYLYTNMKLSVRLRKKLYRHSGPRHSTVAPYYRECGI